MLEQTVSRPDAPPDVLRGVAQYFAQTAQLSKIEPILKKLTAEEPYVPEGWYNLAQLEVVLGNKDEAIKDLETSVELSDQRLKTNPSARDIRGMARADAGFNPIRESPEFQKLVPQ